MKKIDCEILIEYICVFWQYLVISYVDVLSYYDDQEVLFLLLQDFEGDKIVIVCVFIWDGECFDIKVVFKVCKKDKEWKVYDMVVEGISML